MLRSDSSQHLRLLGTAGLVLALVLLATPALAKDKPEIIESYKGNVLAAQAGAGASSMGQFNIYRWSSDEERDEIIASIKDATGKANPDREVAQTLRGLEKAGYAFTSERIGYPIRYTRQVQASDGSRQIVMATDRPVTFHEAYTDSMAGDFDVTVIVLKFDGDGKGEGIISVGTELQWDEAKQQVAVTNYSSQPIRVMDVRPVEKK